MKARRQASQASAGTERTFSKADLWNATNLAARDVWEQAAKVVEIEIGSPGLQAPNPAVDAALRKVAADLRARSAAPALDASLCPLCEHEGLSEVVRSWKLCSAHASAGHQATPLRHHPECVAAYCDGSCGHVGPCYVDVAKWLAARVTPEDS